MAESLLPIQDMASRHRGLTPEVAASYLQAARVCLDRHHVPPARFTVSSPVLSLEAQVAWDPTDQREKDAWANTTDATENGAYTCALAALELLLNMFAVRRAETGTGSDYYVGPPGAGRDDLEDCLRFEVSGVDGGDNRAVETRLNRKMTQASEGESSLPAIAGVVGFRAQTILVSDRIDAT